MPMLSLTMIVLNEESNLPRCLESVRNWVEEIIVVDTGSTDRTKEIALEFGATVINCNPDTHPDFFFVDDERTGAPPPYSGNKCLGNFGGARNIGLSAATGKYVLWLDADDVLGNAHMLPFVVTQMESQGYDSAWMLYDYARDSADRQICTLWRERIIRKGSALWVNPIHEVMIPTEDFVGKWKVFKVDNMIVKHHRPADRTAVVSHRNYKVLIQHLKKNPDDARTLFYFGNEARFIDPDKAIQAYERYVEVSGWSEERAFARCSLGELYEQRGSYGKAFANFAAGAVDHPIPDGWYGLARLAYQKEDWAKCCEFTEYGLKRGNPDTVIMVNPMSRSFAPHLFYNVALNKLGRVQEAYASCVKGLEQVPDEPHLLHNAKVFKDFIEGQARPVQSVPYFKRPCPDPDKKLHIVMWSGPAVEPWYPRSPNEGGIGGSETACIEVCKHLASLGHKVEVYSECAGHEGEYDGVSYRHHSAFNGVDCDVFISSRQPMVIEAYPVTASLKLLWVHDIHVGVANQQMHAALLRFDRILALSNWHKQFLLDTYQWLHPDTVIVTRNGIDTERFTQNAPAKTNKLIYSSSPNRGLEVLLDIFPRIRAEVPDAELHVFYGFESWEATERMYRNEQALQQIAAFKQRIANTPGVFMGGRVDQTTLAREMMSAKIWSYPTWFTETSCITAMEAQAAGCIPVTSDLAALSETARFGVRLQGSNQSPEYQQAFVSACIDLMRDEEKRSAIARAGMHWAAQLTWKSLAEDWSEMFYDMIKSIDLNPVHQYSGMIGKRAA